MSFSAFIYHLLPLPLLTTEGVSQSQDLMLAVARQMGVIQMRKILFFRGTKVTFGFGVAFGSQMVTRR